MIHVYTGNGKGKTTSAIGQTIRTSGFGGNVLFTQFIKDMEYSEINILKSLPNVDYHRYGYGCFINRLPEQKDIDVVKKGINEILQFLKTKDYKLVVLDELNIALYYNLIFFDDIYDILKLFKDNLDKDLVITGRYAPTRLLSYADLVTEMKEIKHYYHSDVTARDGIER